jgi:pyrroline-5-carboxylate reductase
MTKKQKTAAPGQPSEGPVPSRLAVIGAGKMAGTLLQAFLRSGLFAPENIIATVQHESRAAQLAAQLGITVTTDNLRAARESDLILLGVKPQSVLEVLHQIRPALSSRKALFSIAAAVKTSALEEAAGVELPVLRAMPNTPALIGCGATALCRGRYVTPELLALAERMFLSVGRTVLVEEKHMDAVTGLSGSGPAYIYIILEALAEAGVKVGLPRDVATLLAAQTALGAASMVLETGSHPALLKDAVTTPAGCTMDGILELEEGGLRVTLIKAVMRATARSRELAAQ